MNNRDLILICTGILGVSFLTFVCAVSVKSMSSSKAIDSEEKIESSVDSYVPETYTYGPATEKVDEAKSTHVMVRVLVADDTKQNPLPAESELWFRGHGSWWLKPDTKFGMAGKKLGRRKVNEKDEIVLYSDGRGGGEITIPFMMTAEMNPNGSDRDSIIITISDHEIEIVGLPIKAANGNPTMKVKRRR